MPAMRGVTRYIAGQVALVALFVTVALTITIWLSQSLRFADIVIEHGLPAGPALYFLMLMMPSLIALILPVALFIAVTFVYNKLITDSEIVVLRATGLSHLALARPALLLAVAATVIGYSVTLYFLPASYRAFKDMKHTIQSSLARATPQVGVFTEIGNGLTFYARARDPDGTLLGVLVHDTRAPGRSVTYTAARGLLMPADDGPRIVMLDGSYQEADPGSGELSVLQFDRLTVALADFAGAPDDRQREPQERFLHELFRPTDAGTDEALRARLGAEGHQRLAGPLYGLAFTVTALAMLLAGQGRRHSQRSRIAAAAAAVVLLQGLSVALYSLAARLPALLPLMYGGPLLPTAAGLYALARPARARGRRLIDGARAA